MADEKAIGEKAALVLDLLINWSHVKLPIVQAETQPPSLLRLEDKCGLCKKARSSDTTVIGPCSTHTAHSICQLTSANEVANMALSHRQKFKVHSGNPAQQRM